MLTDAQFLGAKPAKAAGSLTDAEFLSAPKPAAPAGKLTDAEFMAAPKAMPTNPMGIDQTHYHRMKGMLRSITGKDIEPGSADDPFSALENVFKPGSAFDGVMNAVAHPKETADKLFNPKGPDHDVDYKSGLGSLEAAIRLAQTENDDERESVLRHVYGDKNVGRDSKGGLYVVQKGKKIAAHPKALQALLGGFTGSAPEALGGMLGATGGAALGSLGGPLDEFTIPTGATVGAGLGGSAGHAVQEMGKLFLGDYHQKPGDLVKHVSEAALWNALPEGAFRTVAGAVKQVPKIAPQMIPRDPVGGHLFPAPAITAPDMNQPVHRVAEQLADRLFTIHSQGLVDKMVAEEMFHKLPKDATPADFEAITHFIENPTKVKLTAPQKKFFDQFIVPLRTSNRRAYEAIMDLQGTPPTAMPQAGKMVRGVEVGPGGIGHSHRVAQGKGNFFDRMIKGGHGDPAPRGLRTGADSLKRRKLYAVVDPNGVRRVLHVDKGKLSVYDPATGWKQAGAYHRVPKLGDPLEIGGVANKVTDATTKEIEKSGAATYYKHSYATHLLEWAQLNAAERNVRFLNDLKPELEKAGLGTRDPMIAQSNGFRGTELPQFAGWKLEPHLADVLDDVHNKINPKEGDWLLEGAEKVNNFIMRTIIFNPVFHSMNMGAQWAISRGATGWLSPSGHVQGFNTLLKAARSTYKQDHIYKMMMDHGAAFQATRRENGKMAADLAMLASGNVIQQPAKWAGIAKTMGYASPIELAKGIWRGMEKAMWAGGDILEMSRIMELQDRGYALEDAIKRAERTIVNYRVPPRVFNSRVAKKFLSSDAFIFNSYHYGVMNAYANMAADLVKPSATAAERLEAMDQMAALGLIMTKGLPAMDKVAQQISGQDNAQFHRPGMTKWARESYEFATGKRPLEMLPAALVTPSVGVDVLYKVLYNKDPFTGKRLIDYSDGPGRAMKDAAFAVLDQFGFGSALDKVLTGKVTPVGGMLTQGVGVQFPNEAGKKFVQARNRREDAKRNAKHDEEIEKMKKDAEAAGHRLLQSLHLTH